MLEALERGEIKHGQKTVVVIRYEGPKGGPGMPEMRMSHGGGVSMLRSTAAC